MFFVPLRVMVGVTQGIADALVAGGLFPPEDADAFKDELEDRDDLLDEHDEQADSLARAHALESRPDRSLGRLSEYQKAAILGWVVIFVSPQRSSVPLCLSMMALQLNHARTSPEDIVNQGTGNLRGTRWTA